MKENNRVHRLPDKGSSATQTSQSQKKIKTDTANAIRRQTYTINGKENLIPDDVHIMKSSMQSSSPIFPKDMSSLNVLNENSVISNFSIQSFPSYDSVDAPMKYFNFKSELELSVNISEELNPINHHRRSTVLPSMKMEDDVNLSLPDKNYLLDFCRTSSSPTQKEEFLSGTDVSTPVRGSDFLSNLTDEISLELNVENVTFSVKNVQEDVFLTPQKNFLDEFIFSPSNKLRNSSPFISKSTDCLADKKDSSFQSYKRNDLFFISPPRKSLNKRCKKTPEDPFPHRSGMFFSFLLIS